MESRLLCLFLVTMVTAVSGVTVTTDYGDVIGRTITVQSGVRVDYYYAIPYAKPPVGQLRFKDPQPPESWSAPLQATSPGPVCPQPLIFLELTNPAWTNVNEDCLTLNIFAPNDASNRPYPVMFWIHGGGFQGGGTISYPGHVLAAKGVVMVVINYRLGHLGFISTSDDAAPGNYGLKDQVLALQFVRDNIRNFGGDPGKVTIFGESAGASAVGLLSIIPAAKGLFHQLILESGTDTSNWAVNEIEQHQEKDTKKVAESLGCPSDNSMAMMDCLRSKDWKDIIAVPATHCGVGHFCAGFQPVVDGTFLPDHPHYLRKEGRFDPLPTLVGSNTGDGALLMSYVQAENLQAGLDKDKFKQVIRDLVTFYSPRLNGKDEEAYEALKAMYPPSDDINQNILSLKDIYTDTHYTVYDYVMLESLRERENDVYHYIFGYRSVNTLLPEWMGATHLSEINYIFGIPQMKQRQNDAILRDLKLVEATDFTQDDLKFSQLMQDLWTNFAKFGNPTPTEMTSVQITRFRWEKATTGSTNGLSYLYLDRDVENKVNYRQEYIKFWTRCFRCIAPKMYQPESTKSRRRVPVRYSECDCPDAVKIGSQLHAPLRLG